MNTQASTETRRYKRPNAVEAAQRRATVSAYLSNNPGPQPTTALCKAMDLPGHVMIKLLSGMAEQGLIDRMPTPRGAESIWQWRGDGAPQGIKANRKSDASLADVERAASKLRDTLNKVKPPTQPQEVELMIGGIVVVVGRNPATGRIRVTLEEAK